MKLSTTNWDEIPVGFYLHRIMSKSHGGWLVSISLKTDNRPWFEQPRVPFYTEAFTRDRNQDFWQWASDNLPRYDYDPEA